MEFIPVCKPILPLTEKLRPYLEKIDANRYYSNLGPLTVKFEERLAIHFGVAADEVVTSANGTLALIQALKAFNVKPNSFCIMPSWTFTATSAAALITGLIPFFIDVNGLEWCIHPDDVLPLIKKYNIGAVIPVAPFGAPLDLKAWQEFHISTGIPVIIDAAAGFDSFSTTQSANVTIPFMVSLHATKVIGIGEGAVVVTRDASLAKNIRMQGNFGFYNSRESLLPGINAKLSEYASAVGLAALDEWPKMRKAWQDLSFSFDKYVKNTPFITNAPFFNQGWVSSYGHIQFTPPYTADIIRKELAQRNIGSISWWGKGCHMHLAYKHCEKNDLPATSYLVNQVLGLPFWIGLGDKELNKIFDCLQEIIMKINLKPDYA